MYVSLVRLLAKYYSSSIRVTIYCNLYCMVSCGSWLSIITYILIFVRLPLKDNIWDLNWTGGKRFKKKNNLKVNNICTNSINLNGVQNIYYY